MYAMFSDPFFWLVWGGGGGTAGVAIGLVAGIVWNGVRAGV